MQKQQAEQPVYLLMPGFAAEETELQLFASLMAWDDCKGWKAAAPIVHTSWPPCQVRLVRRILRYKLKTLLLVSRGALMHLHACAGFKID